MSDPAVTLIGREDELGRLAGLVDGIRSEGGGLVIRGDAGVGKSALLAAASARAREHGVRVLATTGVESESRLPFAALHELLLPFLDRIDQLPELQRNALEMALGLARRDAVADVFMVGLATLGLVTEVAAEEPLLIVVEDAHWVDRSSGNVLGFVARRLAMEPALMWFAVRAGLPSAADDAGLPELELEGLSEDASVQLLDLQTPSLTADLRRLIVDHAVGNPLALIELPQSATDGAFGGGSALPGSIPLTTRLEHAFAGRLDDLDDRARTLLLVAALEDGEPAELLEAAGRIQGSAASAADWQRVVEAGLGLPGADRFRFRHPLMRSAIEQATPLEERRAAHDALAEVLAADLDRSTWHRAKATRGQDEAVAAALAAAAERARLRGGGDVAIAALEQSAALTPALDLRAVRLWQAGELAWRRGRWLESSQLLTAAQQLGLPPFEAVVAAHRLEAFSGTMAPTSAVVEAFMDVVARLLDAGERAKALEALATVSVRTYWGELDDETRRKASEAAWLIDAAPDQPSRLVFLAHLDPIRNGRAVLDELAHMTPGGIDGDGSEEAGLAATAVWADDVALPFLRAAGEQFRAHGRLGSLAVTLASEAWAHLHRGAAVPGLTAAAESGRLAAETGLVLYVQAAKLAEAVALAHRGQVDDAQALIVETEAFFLPLGATPLLAFVALARGRVELAAGRHADAYRRFARLFDHDDVAFHPFLRGHLLADLAEAAAAGGGDLELVRGYVAEWERIAAETGAPYLGAQVSYAAALLAEDRDAERLFRAAIATAAPGWEFFAARARLAYAVWLRRSRRRAADARAPLREAAELFIALGQEPYAERTLAELRASGESVRRRAPETWGELTAQELQIAQLAAQGLSNREIGERLYISPRTVGTHLYHLFPKLGISARAQLRDVLAPD